MFFAYQFLAPPHLPLHSLRPREAGALEFTEVSEPYLRQDLESVRWSLSPTCRESTWSTSGIPVFSNRQGSSSVRILLHMPKSFLESEGWSGVAKAEGPRGD